LNSASLKTDGSFLAPSDTKLQSKGEESVVA
jgi:hypothetical protein